MSESDNKPATKPAANAANIQDEQTPRVSASEERLQAAEAKAAATADTLRTASPQQNTGTPGGTSTVFNEPAANEVVEPINEPERGEYTCLRCKRRVAELKTVEFDADDVPEGNPNNLPHKRYHGDVCSACEEALTREFDGS